MLYRLEVENFFSVRDEQVLDLSISPNVPDPDGRFAPIFPGSLQRAPKVVALYGANASGKTTVLRALEFLFNMVRWSAQSTSNGFLPERFNDRESGNRPIRLAVEFGGVMNLSPAVLARAEAGEAVEAGLYRYELTLDVREGVATRISGEALRQKPNGQGKWQRLFERDENGAVKDSRTFSISGFGHLLNTLRPNASVLSTFAFFQHPTAQIFVEAAGGSMFLMGAPHPASDQSFIDFLKGSPDIVEQLGRELSRIDLGVEGMRFVDTPQGPQPMFKHSGLEMEMPWALESHGTRAFIKMFPALVTTLQNGGLCAIDEFDLAIHPLVLPELLRWFHGDQGRNRLDAQLWFSCHSASLLDDLKKEEIVICEKDRHGRTRFHSLMDVKVRRDNNHYRKYLSGAYGGVPQIG